MDGALAPTVGLLLALAALEVHRSWHVVRDVGRVPGAFHDPAVALSMRGLGARITASITTLGFGGAMGLEGPSLYLGATIGSQLSGCCRALFRDADRRC